MHIIYTFKISYSFLWSREMHSSLGKSLLLKSIILNGTRYIPAKESPRSKILLTQLENPT